VLRILQTAIHAYFKCLSVFIRMLQMFHVDILKVDQVLRMLQWHRWLADDGLPQGFTSCLAPSSHGAPRPLLSLPLPSLLSVSSRSSSSVDERAESQTPGRRGAGSADEHAESRTSCRHSSRHGRADRRSRHEQVLQLVHEAG
jgi:hypothetical protein